MKQEQGTSSRASGNDKGKTKPLKERLCEDIELSGRAERTKKQYRLVFEDFERFLGKSAIMATDDDVRGYALHLVKQRKLSASSLRVYMAALKLLFETTLRRKMPVLDIVKPQGEARLPVVGVLQVIAELVMRRDEPATRSDHGGHESTQEPRLRLVLEDKR